MQVKLAQPGCGSYGLCVFCIVFRYSDNYFRVIKRLSVHLDHVRLARYIKSRAAQILVLQSLIKQAVGQWVLTFLTGASLKRAMFTHNPIANHGVDGSSIQIISFKKISANRKLPSITTESINHPRGWPERCRFAVRSYLIFFKKNHIICLCKVLKYTKIQSVNKLASWRNVDMLTHDKLFLELMSHKPVNQHNL